MLLVETTRSKMVNRDKTNEHNIYESEAPRYMVKHHTVAEIARLWSLSADSVRAVFRREPGVLIIGNPVPRRGKRAYTTLRIPAHVVERVGRRLSRV